MLSFRDPTILIQPTETQLMRQKAQKNVPKQKKGSGASLAKHITSVLYHPTLSTLYKTLLYKAARPNDKISEKAVLTRSPPMHSILCGDTRATREAITNQIDSYRGPQAGKAREQPTNKESQPVHKTSSHIDLAPPQRTYTSRWCTDTSPSSKRKNRTKATNSERDDEEKAPEVSLSLIADHNSMIYT